MQEAGRQAGSSGYFITLADNLLRVRIFYQGIGSWLRLCKMTEENFIEINLRVQD